MSNIAQVATIPADAEVGPLIVAGKYIEVREGGYAFTPCARCGGTGFHGPLSVFDGRCFDCGQRAANAHGVTRTIEAENKLAKARARAAAKREAAEAVRQGKREAAIAAIVEANPAVATAMTWYAASHNDAEMGRETGLGGAAAFVSDIYRWDGDVPAWKVERIVEAVERTWDDAVAAMAAEVEAAANPAPLGRVRVEGKIVSLNWVDNTFDPSGRSSTPKSLVVSDEGWKVYITTPRKVLDAVDEVVGTRVTFTAELSEGSKPDPQFRIGKRPTQIAVAAAV